MTEPAPSDPGDARSPAAGRQRALSSWTAGLLVFFASAAVLVLEILAGRLLAPYVGVTLETYSGIIGVVLAGIALGTWLGGMAADRVDPHRLLGPLLVWGGGLALLSVPAISWLGPASVNGGPEQIVTLAAVGFFGPAAVLSAVAPTVVKLQLADLHVTGSVVGRLSALGTAGAIAGTFVTGFVLLSAVPTRPIVFGVGGALVVAGILLWLRFGHRAEGTLLSLGLAVAVTAGGATAVLPPTCQWESAYYCVRIDADPGRPTGRTLWLDQLRHSYVDLSDPAHLEFPYAQLFADVLASAEPPGAPVRALHVGGGGFTMPRYLRATRPGSESVVLELDPLLVDLAQTQLGLQTGPHLAVEAGDARLTLRRQPDASFDVVFGDAFGGLAVPWHLTTFEFLEDVRRVLRPDGTYVLNLIDYRPFGFARAELATLRAVFHEVAVIAAPSGTGGFGGGTFVMVGSVAPIDAAAIADSLAARGSGRVMLADPVSIDDFIAGAQILTDDHAPVDQLISRPDF